MRQRGFAMMLVISVITCLGIAGSIALAHLSSRRQAARGELRRTQALWLARSGAGVGRALQRQVALDGETATLTVRAAGKRVSAQVILPRWGTARVESEAGKTWEERWEPLK